MELIIWQSSRIPLNNVSQTLAENPTTNLLNDFNVQLNTIEVIQPEFLAAFAWSILEAKLRPQIHIVLIDNQQITNENQRDIFKICACAIDFVASHPMKYVIFYDLVNFDPATISNAMYFTFKIRQQIEDLSYFARIHVHQGEPLLPHFNPNNVLSRAGLVNLAQSIIRLTYQVLGRLND